MSKKRISLYLLATFLFVLGGCSPYSKKTVSQKKSEKEKEPKVMVVSPEEEKGTEQTQQSKEEKELENISKKEYNNIEEIDEDLEKLEDDLDIDADLNLDDLENF